MTTRASKERPGEGDRQPLSQRSNRVLHVPFGTDRRSMGIEYDRERQVFRDASGLKGKGRSFEKRESVGCDAKTGVMMETSPASPFELSKAEFALQFLVVRSMRQRSLMKSMRTLRGAPSGKVESQYFVGSASLSGHSITNHSTGCGPARSWSRGAGLRRTAAKREDKVWLEPSRHSTWLQASAGSRSARAVARCRSRAWATAAPRPAARPTVSVARPRRRSDRAP